MYTSCSKVLKKYASQFSKQERYLAKRNIALYLAFKALDGTGNVISSLLFFLRAMWLHPYFLFSTPQSYRVLVRLLSKLLLPRTCIDILKMNYPNLMNPDALFSAINPNEVNEL